MTQPHSQGAIATEPVQRIPDQRCIDTIRFLAVDAVQQANSGHPGAPMGAAAMVYTLWDRILNHNPAGPDWPNRDRFILSAGHASMLLYAMLHLTGYDLPLDELKRFRQWNSRTPGHPEHGLTPGVETTSGPLGQGFANGVGMAIAERHLAATFNRPGHDIIDHFTYAMVSDGDLQEGVAAEAASLAGTLGLGKIVYLYDSNRIQIEGSTDLAFTEDVAVRFEAYGWHVAGPVDGNDIDAVERAVREGQAERERPTLIVCNTHIAWGSPNKQDTAAAHGEPLGTDEIVATKTACGWPPEPTFHVPDDVREHMTLARERGAARQSDWDRRFALYAADHPELAKQLQRALCNEFPDGWDTGLEQLFPANSRPMATRAASGKVLNHLAERLPGLIGGSADLAPSNKTMIAAAAEFSATEPAGRNLHFGVREHAMGAIANGIALHGGLIPYCGTFLVFSDYMRPAARVAALTELQVVYIWTHDSIGVGEDGPTHQPIEHLAALRAIPNCAVIRPADACETAEAWRAAMRNRKGPTALALTRQNLPVLDQQRYGKAQGLHRGAYVLLDPPNNMPVVLLLATGSEVSLALDAAELLAADRIPARVVSMPCWEFFEKQPQSYRDEVLPPGITARVAIEAGVSLGWHRWVGDHGAIVAIDRFGASAPAQTIFEKFGLTAERVAESARQVLKRD